MKGLFSYLAREAPCFVVFACVFSGNILRFPSLFVRGEPFAEVATNYVSAAISLPAVEQLLVPDFGYYPVVQRVLVFAISQVVSLAYLPLALQLVALGFIAVACASFACSLCGRIVKDGYLRAVIAVWMGLFPDYEMFTFINAVYFGACLVPYLALNMVHRQLSLSWALAGVCAITKPFFACFTPVALWGALVVKTQAKLALGMVLLAAVCSVQAVMVQFHADGLPLPVHQVVSVGDLMIGAFRFFVHCLGLLFAWSSLPSWLCAGGILAVVARRWWDDKGAIRVDLAALICGGTASVLAAKASAALGTDWLVSGVLPWNRYSFFIIASAAFLVARAVDTVRKSMVRRSVATLWLGLWIPFLFAQGLDVFGRRLSGAADWRAYSDFLTAPSYCVPVNPDIRWLMTKNCGYLAQFPSIEGKRSGLLLDVPATYEGAARWSIEAILVRNYRADHPIKYSAITAADSSGRIVIAEPVGDVRKAFVYFKFSESVTSPGSLAFKDRKNAVVEPPAPDALAFMGRTTSP